MIKEVTFCAALFCVCRHDLRARDPNNDNVLKASPTLHYLHVCPLSLGVWWLKTILPTNEVSPRRNSRRVVENTQTDVYVCYRNPEPGCKHNLTDSMTANKWTFEHMVVSLFVHCEPALKSNVPNIATVQNSLKLQDNSFFSFCNYSFMTTVNMAKRYFKSCYLWNDCNLHQFSNFHN